jgi:hypothetical protein
VDSGSSTDDEESKVNISDQDGDTAIHMWQDMINYNPQSEMFIGVSGRTGSAQGVAGICWINASTNKPVCSAI